MSVLLPYSQMLLMTQGTDEHLMPGSQIGVQNVLRLALPFPSSVQPDMLL